MRNLRYNLWWKWRCFKYRTFTPSLKDCLFNWIAKQSPSYKQLETQIKEEKSTHAKATSNYFKLVSELRKHRKSLAAWNAEGKYLPNLTYHGVVDHISINKTEYEGSKYVRDSCED